jgi:hypothetical protein
MIGLLRGGAASAALTVVTVGLASTLAACASGSNAVNGSPVGAAGGAGGSTVATGSPTPSGTSTALPSPPSTVNPGGPMSPVPSASPSPGALLTAPPAKSRYVPIDQESQSADGRTLYLEIEARGGACGQYVEVLQQSTTEVRVGLAQLEPRVGVMCPNYIGPRTFTLKLPSPVGDRTVIDLATGKKIGS